MRVDSRRPPSRPGAEGDASTGSLPSDEARACIYQWLGGVFAREVSLEALLAYRSAGGIALLDQVGAHPALAPLAAALRGLALDHEGPETAVADLAGAYSRLFLGVGGRRSAPPYESAYTNERGLLFQEPSSRTAAELADLDLHVSEAFPEPPDHLAVQLEIMATLARRVREAGSAAERDRQRRRQLAFLEARLLPWIGLFGDACVASDRSGFYATAATCLVAFVTADARQLRAACR